MTQPDIGVQARTYVEPFQIDTDFFSTHDYANVVYGKPPIGNLYVHKPWREFLQMSILSEDNAFIIGRCTLNNMNPFRLKDEYTDLTQDYSEIVQCQAIQSLWVLNIWTSQAGLGRYIWNSTDQLLANTGGGFVFVSDASKTGWTSQQVILNQHLGLVEPVWTDGQKKHIYRVPPHTGSSIKEYFLQGLTRDFLEI